jgi:oxygen-independent coproporphyrinogen-3 oxidase
MRPPTVLAAAAAPRAAYVHLPFCRRRCHYCDFPIVPVGDRPGAADAAAERYVALLHRELEGTPSAPHSAPLTSVYFGGGTPSLTPPRLIKSLIDSLRARHGLADDCECTMEMDPGTFDASRLDAFLEAGVTRVSMGVQSYDAALLKHAGRAHTVEDIHASLELLLDERQRAGLSVSVDLIGGLPGMSDESWERSLAAVGARVCTTSPSTTCRSSRARPTAGGPRPARSTRFRAMRPPQGSTAPRRARCAPPASSSMK